MGMTFDKLYPVLRVILGDREVHGLWNYPAATLDSALKATFLLGRAPKGYALNELQTAIEPDLTTGDHFAMVCYDTALLLIGGEDGAMRIQTRAITVVDSGDRKRSLMRELTQKVYEIRDGSAVFATWQSLAQFLNAQSGVTAGDALYLDPFTFGLAPAGGVGGVVY